MLVEALVEGLVTVDDLVTVCRSPGRIILLYEYNHPSSALQALQSCTFIRQVLCTYMT